jgi:hypothetical protein
MFKPETPPTIEHKKVALGLAEALAAQREAEAELAAIDAELARRGEDYPDYLAVLDSAAITSAIVGGAMALAGNTESTPSPVSATKPEITHEAPAPRKDTAHHKNPGTHPKHSTVVPPFHFSNKIAPVRITPATPLATAPATQDSLRPIDIPAMPSMREERVPEDSISKMPIIGSTPEAPAIRSIDTIVPPSVPPFVWDSTITQPLHEKREPGTVVPPISPTSLNLFKTEIHPTAPHSPIHAPLPPFIGDTALETPQPTPAQRPTLPPGAVPPGPEEKPLPFSLKDLNREELPTKQGNESEEKEDEED